MNYLNQQFPEYMQNHQYAKLPAMRTGRDMQDLSESIFKAFDIDSDNIHNFNQSSYGQNLAKMEYGQEYKMYQAFGESLAAAKGRKNTLGNMIAGSLGIVPGAVLRFGAMNAYDAFKWTGTYGMFKGTLDNYRLMTHPDNIHN